MMEHYKHSEYPVTSPKTGSTPKDMMAGVFNRPQKDVLRPEDFDLIADKKTSQLWVLHEKKFINQGRVIYAEYNQDKHSLRFVSKDGSAQYLGTTIQTLLQPHLEKAHEITTILTDREGNINDLCVIPLKKVTMAQNIHKNG